MLKNILSFCFQLLAALTCFSQVVTECPQNIGFENGTFSGWECYTGDISGTGNQFPDGVRPAVIMVTPSAPVPGRQTIIKRGSGVDQYGNFSLDSPNGSDYVVQLGNAVNGRSAERISYTVNVPSNVETYSIIFNYAVVFENPFNHDADEQPAFRAQVFDVTTNSSTDCGSFEFVAPGLGGGIPGFKVSELQGQSNSNVLYKPWSPVLVNLTDYRGHTIRLEFTTNDCSRGAHFGYAYIDFNENCSIPISGNVTCPDIDSVTLRTLPGFFQYSWYDASHHLIGNADSLVLSPAPPPGTRISVELIPYPGLGCALTLYTTIESMDMHFKDPPPQCITKGVDLTDISLKVGNSSDLSYTYWRDEQAKIPVADPRHIKASGVYYVKGQSSSGCFLIRPVNVIVTQPEPIIVTQPEAVYYPNTVDITRTFTHQPGMTYTYWTDKNTRVPVKTPNAVRLGGTFYIKATDAGGCETTAPVTVDVIITGIIIPNTFTPNNDGINDVFTILVNSRYKIKSLRIFNRWGDPVFFTTDISNYWDGFKDNKMMPAGVYYWVLEGNDDTEKRLVRSGYVTIIR